MEPRAGRNLLSPDGKGTLVCIKLTTSNQSTILSTSFFHLDTDCIQEVFDRQGAVTGTRPRLRVANDILSDGNRLILMVS